MTDCEGLCKCNDLGEISVSEGIWGRGKGNPGAYGTESGNNKFY